VLASLLDMNCHFEGQQKKDSSMGTNGPLMWQVVWCVSALLLLPSATTAAPVLPPPPLLLLLSPLPLLLLLLPPPPLLLPQHLLMIRLNFGVGRGKHNPPEWRGKHTEPAYDTKANPRATELALDSILPVVLIKDPLTWMGSMCRHKYKAQGGWLKGDICPNFFESERSDVWFRYTSTKKGTDLKGLQLESYQKFMGGFRGYPSLLHMWRDWYQAYFNYSTPRLMVRYEDLLFNQNQTLHEICACAGGRMSESTRTTADSSKDDHSKAESSDRDSSLRRYKSAKSRVTKCKRIGELKDLASTSLCNDTAYTHQDLDYVNKSPGVQELMNAFKYSTNYSYIEP
jgi:hypothetical protein